MKIIFNHMNPNTPYFISSMTSVAYVITKSDVLFVLSVIATTMAIISYYFQIRKNRKS